MRGGLGESQALSECRAGGIRWGIGLLGLVEEAWRGVVGREEIKELANGKELRGQLKVRGEETVFEKRKPQGVFII